MKRLFDIIASLAGLLFSLPILVIIGLCIKLNDKGPVFFRQKRVGKDSNLFILYKFRSMQFLSSSKEEIFEPGNISQVTFVGKVLRRTKLDELPQLMNVLKGEMSIVGPRPEIQKWVTFYSEKWQRILTVKPGITDNASIEFRNEEELLAKSSDPEKTYRNVILPRKLDIYTEYVDNCSFMGDLKIIFFTIKAVILK